MNINFTLVIQLFNFFVAYVLIERLLVRPAIGLIKAEDQEHFRLNNLVAFNKEQLNHMHMQAEQEWRLVQEVFAKAIPRVLTPELGSPKQIVIQPQESEKSVIEKTKQEAIVFLVKKMSHE